MLFSSNETALLTVLIETKYLRCQKKLYHSAQGIGESAKIYFLL